MMKGEKNIRRYEHNRSRAWWVRVMWAGEKRSRMFPYARYGGVRAALAAAREYRDAVEREMGKPRTPRQVVGASRTSTGVVGVWHEGDRIAIAWAPKVGKAMRTSVSTRKHGLGPALKKAFAIREARLKESLQ